MSLASPTVFPSREAAIRESLLIRTVARAAHIRAQVQRRVRLLSTLGQDADARLVAVEKARRDPLWFINTFCWTLDPRNVAEGLPGVLPLALRPRQEEYVRWLDERILNRQNGLTEKSRDEGMTWVLCAFYVHHWLFWRDFKGGIGSRKEALVDRLGDPDSIFEKIRFLIDKLPRWMKPRGFRRKLHATFMRCTNPQNGNTITGEAGDNIGRGGRNTVYFVDEHAAIERAESVDSALSENTRTIIYGSTLKGVGNLFYKKRFSGKINVFTFSWRLNPEKNFQARYLDAKGEERTMYPWYEWAVDRIDDPVIIAQEIDIDYTASAHGIVIPQKYVQAALDLELQGDGERQGGLDVSAEGDDATVYAVRDGPNVLDILPLLGEGIEDDVRERATQDGIRALLYDRLGVGASITRTLARDKDTLPFIIEGLANSEKPTWTEYADRPDLLAQKRFANYAAELWWRLRLRFRNTWERVTQGKPHADEDCISLAPLKGNPHLMKLLGQLSQPTYRKQGQSDKILVNKYGEGTSSPDFAEALMYSFAPAPEPIEQVVPESNSVGFGG